MMHDLLKAILPVVPYLFVLLVLFILFVLIYLFRAFKNEPEKTRRAVMLEISLLRNLRQIFTRKTDVVLENGVPVKRPSFGETISQPIEPPVEKP
jgi:hypothetical protein